MKNKETKKFVLRGEQFDEQAQKASSSSRTRYPSRGRTYAHGFHNVQRETVDNNVLWKYSAVGVKEEIHATGPTTKEYDVLVYLTEKSHEFLIDITYVQELVYNTSTSLCPNLVTFVPGTKSGKNDARTFTLHGRLTHLI